GMVWGAPGAARDALEDASAYAGTGSVCGGPLGQMQRTQQRLAESVVALQQAQLLAIHLGRRKAAGTLQPHEISMGKLVSCRTAIEICRDVRALLGGNGVTLEIGRAHV